MAIPGCLSDRKRLGLPGSSFSHTALCLRDWYVRRALSGRLRIHGAVMFFGKRTGCASRTYLPMVDCAYGRQKRH
jgi:hypothetical protein